MSFPKGSDCCGGNLTIGIPAVDVVSMIHGHRVQQMSEFNMIRRQITMLVLLIYHTAQFHFGSFYCWIKSCSTKQDDYKNNPIIV